MGENGSSCGCTCGAGGCGGGANPLFKEFENYTISQLIDYIQQKHHEYLKSEMPIVLANFELAAAKHAKDLPLLEYLLGLYDTFKEEMERHLLKEEDVLFPLLKELEVAKTNPNFHFGSVMGPIQTLLQEHRGFDHLLGEIQKRTGGFTAPPNASEELVALLESLKKMANDTYVHAALEDQLLFQKAFQVEQRLTTQASEV